MAFPSLRRRPKAELVSRPSDDAFKAAVGAFAKAVLSDDALHKSFLTGNAAVMPGTSWSNQGSTSNNLIARVTQNLASSFQRAPEELEAALAENGLSWGPPFPPGRPLDPFWGYRRPPRTWNFSVGENVQLTPRWNRISFGTLKGIIDSYYAAQICVRHLINDVRSLDYQFIPPQNVLEDATDDIAKAEEFFASPDKRQPFRAWLAEYLQDVLRYDAGSLYIRRNEANEPIALEVVSGSTIIPLIDFFGRSPADETDSDAVPEGIWEGDITPAFLQIIEGMPWVWLAKDDMIYQALNPLPESQYGLAPMEAVLLQANTDIRFQWHFLQMFTAGSVPAGFMEAPPDLSDPIQVQEWQDTWDAVMLGDQSKLMQIRWVPAGAKFTSTKPEAFDKEFPLYLMRCVSAAFGVTPNDLGFTEDVNRSTGEIQVDVQFRIGTLPIVRHVEDVINLFLLEHLKLKARIQFDTGQGTQHRLETAQANDIYIKNGTLGSDEVRMSLGRRISRENPTPRYIDNTRAGPIPLQALYALAGDIDPTTYGPKEKQTDATTFFSAAGVAPVIGSDDYKASQDATANMQRGMLGLPPLPPPPAEPAPDSASKEGMIGGADNTGGPGVTRGFTNPTTITGGISVDTNLQGVDLEGPKIRHKKDDDDEDDVEKEVARVYRAIRDWRVNSLNRVKKGNLPRRFEDLPSIVKDPIWERLQAAKTREEVIAAFSGDILALPKVEARKGLNREAAGIAVQALDTGRVLMIQRTPDHSDDDNAFARWEWPGGRLDGGVEGGEDPSVWAGAVREWQEETGAGFPSGAEPCGGWVSEDGEYEGFVVKVPRETDLTLNPQPEEASRAGWWDPNDLEDDQIRDKVLEQLGDIKPILKAKFKDFHRHTDKIIDHYTPLIQDAMANVLQADTVRHAMEVAYGVSKASQPTAPGSQNTPKYQQVLAGLIGAPQVVLGAGAVGAGAAVAGPIASALTTALGIAALGPLIALLVSLYGDAMVQGVEEATRVSGGSSIPPVSLMNLDLAQWTPGQGGAAAQLADGGLAQMLQQAGVIVQGVVETEINRIGDAIAE
ncbi:MAG: phage portal protein, partial [Thaumarchaeota archaeon]|nr:phage portal protein [Nitrososphaerota archaeon]